MDGSMKPGTREHGQATLRLSFNSTVPAHLRGGVLEVSHVHVPAGERGRGYASMLLQKVCAEADRARKVLMLMPRPYDDGPLDQAQLIEWYAAFGFDLIQTVPVPLMARPAGAQPILKVRPVAAAVQEAA